MRKYLAAESPCFRGKRGLSKSFFVPKFAISSWLLVLPAIGNNIEYEYADAKICKVSKSLTKLLLRHLGPSLPQIYTLHTLQFTWLFSRNCPPPSQLVTSFLPKIYMIIFKKLPSPHYLHPFSSTVLTFCPLFKITSLKLREWNIGNTKQFDFISLILLFSSQRNSTSIAIA